MAGEAEFSAVITAELDEDSLRRLSSAIESSIKSGFAGLQNEIKGLLAESARIIADQLGNVAKGFNKAQQQAADYGSTLRTVDRQTLDLIRHLQLQTDSIEVQNSAIRQITATLVTQQQAQNRVSEERQKQLISERQAADRIRQAEIAAMTEQNRLINIQENNAGQLRVVQERNRGKQRIQITRLVTETIGRLEKGLGTLLAGIGRTVSNAFARSSRTITSSFQRISNTVRTSNSAILRDTSSTFSSRESLMRQSFARQERIVSQSVSRQSRQITELRNQMSRGLTGAATGRGAGGGVGLGGLAAGGGIAGLLTVGIQRFSDLERLNKQFLALTGSLETTNMLMAQVKEFAKLTPFDLVGVADLAKGFLAIGTAAEDVMPQVKAIADAVALTGGGVDELTRIQRAIGQVVSAGRLQGDELNQLAENLPGLNIRKILADQLGVSTPELVKMQEAGKISSEMFVEGLISGLQQDQRLVGASEDLAKTLGGRLANLKESFADFGAAIIGSIAGPLKSGVLLIQTGLQSMANFIKGEVSGALLVLREAAIGAAAGLAAIAAAKGAVEVITLLGRSLSLLATPMGALAISTAVVGAAIAVVWKQSSLFREGVDALWESVKTLATAVKDALAPLFEGFGNLLTETIVPGLTRAADWLGKRLLTASERISAFITNTLIPVMGDVARVVGEAVVTAFRAASSFVTETALPAIKTFVTYMRDVFIPVAADVVSWIGTRVMGALDAMAGFFERIRPIIQPAIDGFRAFGEGVMAVFSGDFGALGRGAVEAITGIGKTLANAWDVAFEALRPIAAKLVDLLKSVFTLDNLQTAFGAFLDVVEWIGRTLGTIVSHPAFLAAVAALVAAAVQIGFRFIKGFAEGVVSNIPALFRIIGTAIVDNWQTVILGVFVGTTVVLPLVRAFQAMGTASAGGFVSGFKAKIAASAGLMQGLLTPGGGAALSRSAALAQDAATARQAAQLQSRLLAFGTQKMYEPSIAGIQAMQADLRAVNQQLTESQRMGLLMRDSFKAFGQMVAGAFGPRSQAQGNVKNFFDTLRQRASEGGRSVGAALAKGIGAGMAAGFLAFQGGKAAGRAGVGGAETIIGGILMGAAVGGAPGAVIGGVAASIGHALGDSARQAAEARARMEEYSKTIRDELTPALEAGSIAMVDFNNAFAMGVDGQPAAQLRANLGPDVMRGLAEAGIGERDVLEAFSRGVEGLRELQHRISDADLGFETFAITLQGITREWKGIRDAIDAINDEELFKSRGAFNAPSTFASKQDFDAAAAAREKAAMIDWELISQKMGAAWKKGQTVAQAALDLTIEKMEVAWRMGVEGPAKAKAENDAYYSSLRRTNAAWDDLSAIKPPPGPKQTEQDLIDLEQQAIDTGEAIIRALSPPGVSTLTTSIADAILSLRGAGQIGGEIFDLSDIFDQAELVQLKNTISSTVAPIIQAALDENIDPVAAFETALPGITAALLEGVDNADLRTLIEGQLKDIRVSLIAEFGDKTPLIDQDDIDFNRNRALGITIPVKIDKEDVNKAITDATTGTNAGARGEGIGVNLMAGIARGILAGQRQAAVAARQAANNIIAITAATAGVQSPSTVFAEIGRFMMEGLAIGLAEEGTKASDIMGDVITDAIDRAVETSKQGTKVLREAGTAMFEAFFGGGLGGSTMLGGAVDWTQALRGFKDGFASVVGEAFRVGAMELKDMNWADLDIFGESAFSLNPGDVLGSMNIGNLMGAADAIKDIGEAMADSGMSAAQVTEHMRSLREQLVFTAGVMGLNVDEVRALLDTLGLSDTALSDFVTALDQVAGSAAGAANAVTAVVIDFGQMIADGIAANAPLLEGIFLDPEQWPIFRAANNLNDAMMALISVKTDELKGLFDEEDIKQFGMRLGLYGDALDAFIEQTKQWQIDLGIRPDLEAAEEAAKNAAEAATEATEAAARAADAAADAATRAAEAAKTAAERMKDQILDSLLFSSADLQTFAQVFELPASFIEDMQNRQHLLLDDTDEQIEALGRSFGLYSSALDAFIESVKQWQIAQGTREPDVEEEDGQTMGSLRRPTVEFINHLYLPYGDPDAIALAVVNRQATTAMVGV